MLDVLEREASALDVEHLAVMQQQIEDGGSKHFVTGEQLRLVLDALVGGEQDRAAPVAVCATSSRP